MKDKNKSKGNHIKWPKIGVLIGTVVLYVALSIIIGRVSEGGLISKVLGGLFPEAAIRGIITQLQMLILVVIVLRRERKGYWLAMGLNGLSLILAVGYTIRTSSIDSLPGVISYVGVILILSLVNVYKQKIKDYIEKNNKQREELLKTKARLQEMAYYDDLTGLPNRVYFKEKLLRDISSSKRDETIRSVVYIDLDDFKDINDTLGHGAGDEALIVVSKRILSVIRDEDILSRFGGDEFLMSLGNVKSVDDIQMIVEKIIGVLQEPLHIKNMDFRVTASIGISLFPYDGENSEQLIKTADMAMYMAKKKGRNQYVLCTEEIREETYRKLLLANKLYKVLENKELYIHYQPKLEISTGDVVGFEALLRWENEECGFVSPGEFIPIVEYTGMIKAIGIWVFKEVCLQYNRWKDRCCYNFHISVNMSPEQLKEDLIIDQIKDILEETGVPPEAIEIEITESTAFSDAYDIIERLITLQKIGLKISIDDFGKEYSSLNRIRSFPIDRIKIDMDFVQGITSGDSKDKAIVKTIIQLANNLGVKVVAEGVETQEQYDFLKKEKCDEVQGFFFYKGMSPSEVEEMLDCKGSKKN